MTERQDKLIFTLSQEQKQLYKGFFLEAQLMMEIMTTDPTKNVVR